MATIVCEVGAHGWTRLTVEGEHDSLVLFPIQGELGAAAKCATRTFVTRVANFADEAQCDGQRDGLEAGGVAAAYFVTFILLGTMIMLNLFIGVIMNSMTEMHAELDAQKQDPSSVPTDELLKIERQLAALRKSLDKATSS